jgi:hypothetical protein
VRRFSYGRDDYSAFNIGLDILLSKVMDLE